MNITILTTGTRGDVQPYIALGLGLKNAGYMVKLAAPITFGALIQKSGLDYSPVRFDAEELMALLQPAEGNIFRMLSMVQHELGPAYMNMFDDFWTASQDADAILISPVAHGAYDCAEKLQVPLLTGWLMPALPTQEFPCFGLPFRFSLGRAYNRLSYSLFEQGIWQSVRPWLNVWRKQKLGLHTLPISSPYARMRANHIPALVGYSAHVSPRPKDWPAWWQTTGYWFLQSSPDWQPSVPLSEFLNAGEPPIVIGFGSMTHQRPHELTAMLLTALKRTGQRAVFLSGWAGLANQDLPNTVFALESVPHDWLFPRAAAVIHHGGAGTTGAGLAAGIPSIIVPFRIDQFAWADRVVALGVGPHAASYQKLTVERLTDCINQTVHDTQMREQAHNLGVKIRSENGVAQAVQLFEKYMQSL